MQVHHRPSVKICPYLHIFAKKKIKFDLIQAF